MTREKRKYFDAYKQRRLKAIEAGTESCITCSIQLNLSNCSKSILNKCKACTAQQAIDLLQTKKAIQLALSMNEEVLEEAIDPYHEYFMLHGVSEDFVKAMADMTPAKLPYYSKDMPITRKNDFTPRFVDAKNVDKSIDTLFSE